MSRASLDSSSLHLGRVLRTMSREKETAAFVQAQAAVSFSLDALLIASRQYAFLFMNPQVTVMHRILMSNPTDQFSM